MLAIALTFFVISVRIKAKETNCENITSMEAWMSTTEMYFLYQKTCILNGTTVISDENVELGGIKNVKVDAIVFDDNKKIWFLPVRVYKGFPSLKFYSADKASIIKISALNFAGLSKLKFLSLVSNGIGVIPEDCFQGLNQLRHIDLGTKTASLILLDAKILSFTFMQLTTE